MSIAALGAAVGGLSKGYMEGQKHRSDMEDAEARRGLVKLQTEETEIKLSDAKRNRAYRDEIAALFSEEGQAPAPAAQPAPIASATPAAPAAPAAGITPPGGDVAATSATPAAAPAAAPATEVRPGNVPPSSDLARMERLIARQQQIDMKYGKIDPMQALEGMKKFRMYQQEGVIDGLRYFEQTGDTNGAIERINATGRQQMPPGTKFEVREEEVIPGSGVKTKNVYAISPDGKASLNYRDLLRSSLSPKEAMSLDTETGVQLATLAFRKESDERLRNIQERQLTAQTAHWKALEAQQAQQTRISLERLGLEKDKYKFETIQSGLNKAYSQAMDIAGFTKLGEDKLANLSDTQLADYRKRLVQGNVIYSVFEKNFDLKTARPGITMTQAAEAARFAAGNRDKIQTDDQGATFVEIGKNKIFVPAPQQRAEAPAPGSAPGPQPAAPSSSPAPAAPGLRTPPTMEQTQAQFRASRDFVAGAAAKASQDPELTTLRQRYEQSLKAGKPVEANNFLAQHNQLKRERYNLTPMGGIADPARLNQ